jgi:hypothetical protein
MMRENKSFSKERIKFKCYRTGWGQKQLRLSDFSDAGDKDIYPACTISFLGLWLQSFNTCGIQAEV